MEVAAIHTAHVLTNTSGAGWQVSEKHGTISGVGTQVVALPGRDARLSDIVVGNKKGTFYFQHQVKKVSRSEWEAAQPKPVGP